MKLLMGGFWAANLLVGDRSGNKIACGGLPGQQLCLRRASLAAILFVEGLLV